MSGILIGTRGSPLAIWQANYVRDAILAANEQLQVELKVIKTSGDKLLEPGSSAMLDKGLFTKEIERELLDGSIALAVHSLKDLPTELPDGLVMGAITVRQDPADALICKTAEGLDAMHPGAKILTGSLRRGSQLLHRRPDLVVEPVRGNVQTRLRKLDESDAEAMILARAGLVRMGLDGRITERLDPVEFLPACGQGALAIEIRQDDSQMRDVLAPLNDPRTQLAVAAERAFLASLGGGCQVPVGAYARFDGPDDALMITGMIASVDGKRYLRETISAAVADVAAAEALGQSLGQTLCEQGGKKIVEEAIKQSEKPS